MTTKPTRRCVWCPTPHILEVGGPEISDGLCHAAYLRELAKLAEDDAQAIAARQVGRA